MRAAIALVAMLTLSACATPNDAHATASAAATDDQGHLRLPGDHAWMDHVAISTDNPAIRDRLAKIVGLNFSVRLVAVPQSKVLIRLLSCSTERAIGLCGNVQFNGRIIAKMARIETPIKGGSSSKSWGILEDYLFQDPASQDAFLDFVSDALAKVQVANK
jgi:hypothetical protein